MKKYEVLNKNCYCQLCNKHIKVNDFVYMVDDNLVNICENCVKEETIKRLSGFGLEVSEKVDGGVCILSVFKGNELLIETSDLDELEEFCKGLTR